MKTPEDEAFDDLARRQGMWGGGFPAKRQMAADKQEPWNEDEWRRNNWRCSHGWLRGEQCEICNAPKQHMAADKLWDRPSVAFDEWWNGDNDESTNPFRLESGAYWAWAGWKAALAQPAQSMKVEGPLHVVCQCDKCKAQPAQEQEEDWGALAEKQLASIKRDTRASFEDAMVRATHKVMAEFEAQPAQEPEMLTIAYQSGYYDGKKAALAGREWNFCERCGKRTADLTVIHTCTPPQEKST